MNARLWIGVSLTVVLIAVAATGGQYLYQHHLSDDVKRLLVAANDEHATVMEVRQYTAQARPLVRTKKDREVLAQFEEAMDLYTSVQEDEQKDTDEYNEAMRNISDADESDECFGSLHKEEHIRSEYADMHVAPPKDLTDGINESLQFAKDCIERRRQESDARTVREKHNSELAIQDVNSVRKAIGLPPVPKPE